MGSLWTWVSQGRQETTLMLYITNTLAYACPGSSCPPHRYGPRSARWTSAERARSSVRRKRLARSQKQILITEPRRLGIPVRLIILAGNEESRIGRGEEDRCGAWGRKRNTDTVSTGLWLCRPERVARLRISIGRAV